MLVVLCDDRKFLGSIEAMFSGVDDGRMKILWTGKEEEGVGTGRVGSAAVVGKWSEVNRGVVERGRPASVLLAGLSTRNARALEEAGKFIRVEHVIWWVFGADFYYNFYRGRLLEPLTARLWRHECHSWKRLARVRAVRWVRRATRARWLRALIKRYVSHIAPVLPYEYFLIRGLIETEARFLRFGGRLDLRQGDEIDGENIQIGNSADPSNNHIDAMLLVKEKGLVQDGRKVVVPLSYGDRDYARIVVRRGRELFGDAMAPMLEFVSLKQYRTVCRSCRWVILNHRRQQGVGNLLASLYWGAEVYLNPGNPALGYFRDVKGVDVLSTRDLGGVSGVRRDENRAFVEREYGSRACDAWVRGVLALAC